MNDKEAQSLLFFMLETNTRNQENQEKFLSKILQIKNKFNVTRLSFINGFAETKLPVAIAYRPNSKVLAQSGGKGISKEQTLISALMESYECHTAENVSFSTVDTYQDGEQTKANPFKIATTLKDYRSVDPIRWCKAKNIFNDEDVYVPFSAVSLDFQNMSYIHKREPMMLTSNGLASGSSWDDACISAIYEIVERHSITINEINKTDKLKLVDRKSIAAEELLNLIELLEKEKDIEVSLYDNTEWEEFPTYKSILTNGHMNWAGFGTHSDPVIAATRAITEANQARMISISGSREDMNKNFYLLSAGITRKAKSVGQSSRPCKMRKYELDKKQTKLNKILDKLKTISKKTYIYRYKQIDPSIFVVRVISEGLHGYNYPGYSRMTILETALDRRIDLEEKETHSPAAG